MYSKQYFDYVILGCVCLNLIKIGYYILFFMKINGKQAMHYHKLIYNPLLAEGWIIVFTMLLSNLKLRIYNFSQNIGSVCAKILPIIFTAIDVK